MPLIRWASRASDGTQGPSGRWSESLNVASFEKISPGLSDPLCDRGCGHAAGWHVLTCVSMLFQFGFDCCLVRYLLAALLERDGFVLVLRSRESFCVSLLLPHTCCVCRVRVHPGHRAGRICTCSTLQWSRHILGRPGSAPHGARGERNRGTT